MATLLIHHPYSPMPRQGILLNPSPAASPAYHPATLPALVPSNASLSSSSSSAPGEASDYFSPSKSPSPSPAPSHSPPAPQNAPKSRNGSNHSTLRRIRFAPLPEPRRDEDEIPYGPVFDNDDASHPSGEQQLTLASALAAATLPLAAHADSDLTKRAHSLPSSVPSSPAATRRPLPMEPFPLDPSFSQSSSDSSELPHPDPHMTIASDTGSDWDILPALSLNLGGVPDSPRKGKKWSKMLKPLLGRSSSVKPPLVRTFSKEEAALINGDAQRGRSIALPSGAGSRNSSVSREASLSRDQRPGDFGAPLDRWTSENGFGAALPISKKKRHLLFGGGSGNGGVPLGRTQSLTSLSGKDDKKAAKARPPPPPPTNGGRRQQRMLNGRVYGAKRNPNANPFANVRYVALTLISPPLPFPDPRRICSIFVSF